jgi:hypothetical protein
MGHFFLIQKRNNQNRLQIVGPIVGMDCNATPDVKDHAPKCPSHSLLIIGGIRFVLHTITRRSTRLSVDSSSFSRNSRFQAVFAAERREFYVRICCPRSSLGYAYEARAYAANQCKNATADLTLLHVVMNSTWIIRELTSPDLLDDL